MRSLELVDVISAIMAVPANALPNEHNLDKPGRDVQLACMLAQLLNIRARIGTWTRAGVAGWVMSVTAVFLNALLHAVAPSMRVCTLGPGCGHHRAATRSRPARRHHHV